MAQARATVNRGDWIFKKVSQTLLEWGYERLDRQRDLKGHFKDWLAHYFPDGRKQARQAMAIAGKVNRPPQDMPQMRPPTRRCSEGLRRKCKFLLS